MQFRPLIVPSLCTILAPSVAPPVLAPSFTLWRFDPCVPAGKSTTKEFERPPLDGPGMPTSAEWKDPHGDPQAFDVDTWSGPDAMGAGTPSADGNIASIELTNHGGNITGPNGAIVEGGLEGSCVEVVMVWTYRYVVTETTCVGVTLKKAGAEVSTRKCSSKKVWREGKVRVGPIQVCPC